ncbi:MAG TPA: peptide deformylase [Solirubrobacteraceae bacterium]|jgi:peptide deformylase|nr:peptide deformylase [Solirubrobacteraceae bacterium]
MPDEQTVRSAVEERIPGAPPEPHHSHDLHADVEVEPEEGAPPVAELDPEARERRDAALRQVRKFGDPVLRATAVPVERFDGALKREAERMTELMHDAIGVGLAATQLGIMHRVLVYRAYADDADTVLVNPVLEWRSEETELGEEGCLSLPGVHVEVERALRVRVRARDESGKEHEVEAEGLTARVIQHEIDHLDGVLILDHISREQRKEAMREMREAVQAERRGEDPDAPPRTADEPSPDGEASPDGELEAATAGADASAP